MSKIEVLGKDLEDLRRTFASGADDFEGGAVTLGAGQLLSALIDDRKPVVKGLVQSSLDKDKVNFVIEVRGETVQVSPDVLVAAVGFAELRAPSQVDVLKRIAADVDGRLATVPYVHPVGTFDKKPLTRELV